MTIEIKIVTANKDIPTWLQNIAIFLTGLKKDDQVRTLTVKVERDC